MASDQVGTGAGLRSERDGLSPLTGFRPDVQALRGLAVLLVVLYHAQVVVPGGFIGVDVFFVISGFVIGRGIVAQLTSSGSVSFREFYLRRARRILPALSIMLVIVVLSAPLLAPVASLTITFRTAIAAALFNANSYLYVAFSGGYFEPSAELNPLLHTWSLSVEEQFYFAIPALLYVGWRLGRRRIGGVAAFRLVVGAMFLVSFGLCALASFSDSIGPLDGVRFAFFSPVTRAWEFAAGLALVVLPSRWFPRSRGRLIAFAGGAGLIATAAFTFSDATTFPGVAALLPVMGASLIVLGGTNARMSEGSRPANALRPLELLGDVSYSWYLWHWPLIVFAGAFWPSGGRAPLVAAAVVSLAPAWASFRYVEQRLTRSPQQRVWPTVALAGCCILAPIAVSLVGPTIEAQVASLPGPSHLQEARELHIDNRKGCDSKVPIDDRPTAVRAKCTFGDAGSRWSVVLLGDSNAGQFSEALVSAAEETNAQLELATMSGCPASSLVSDRPAGSCKHFLFESFRAIQEKAPDLVVVGFSTNTQILRDGRISDERVRETKSGLMRLVSELQLEGTEVAILATVPRPGTDRQDWMLGACSYLLAIESPSRCTPPQFSRHRVDLQVARALEEEVADATGATVWDLADGVCSESKCNDDDRSRTTWRDGDHITVATATDLSDEVTSALSSALER